MEQITKIIEVGKSNTMFVTWDVLEKIISILKGEQTENTESTDQTPA